MIDKEKIAYHIREIIKALGDDPNREGLLETPDRVARMYEEMFRGIGYTNAEIAEKYAKTFTEDDMCTTKSGNYVVVAGIPIFSHCEHHMALMYNMKVSVIYRPVDKVIGLSKIARIAEMVSHRLQLQERMTLQIKDCIQETLNPLGVMVVIEAQHMCMQMRGVQKQNSITITSDFTGAFESAKTREEFMNLIRK